MSFDADEHIGETVTVRGAAHTAAAGAMVAVDDNPPIYVVGLTEWSEELEGKPVEVTGVLKQPPATARRRMRRWCQRRVELPLNHGSQSRAERLRAAAPRTSLWRIKTDQRLSTPQRRPTGTRGPIRLPAAREKASA
jgi:hypothetical protein